MKKRILILAGGFSKEREISLKTAKGVFNQIKKEYNVNLEDLLNVRSFLDHNRIYKKPKEKNKLTSNYNN